MDAFGTSTIAGKPPDQNRMSNFGIPSSMRIFNATHEHKWLCVLQVGEQLLFGNARSTGSN
jgi:hypothetical protein